MRVTITPDGMAELERIAAARARHVAVEVAKRARDNSPDGSRRLGFRASIRTQRIKGGSIVGSTDQNAHIIEFGSQDSPEFAPMRRAVSGLGLKLNDLGRSRGRSGRKRGSGR